MTLERDSSNRTVESLKAAIAQRDGQLCDIENKYHLLEAKHEELGREVTRQRNRAESAES